MFNYPFLARRIIIIFFPFNFLYSLTTERASFLWDVRFPGTKGAGI